MSSVPANLNHPHLYPHYDRTITSLAPHPHPQDKKRGAAGKGNEKGMKRRSEGVAFPAHAMVFDPNADWRKVWDISSMVRRLCMHGTIVGP